MVALERNGSDATIGLTLDLFPAPAHYFITFLMSAPASSILVVDVGNSSTSLGLYRNGRIQRQTRFDTRMTTPALIRRVVNQLGASTAWTGAMVATVVPAKGAEWRRTLRQWVPGPVGLLDHRCNLGLPITYPQPATIGPDRLANACAGVHRYGAPLIVADFGTAVTFDVITRKGGYEGGIIGPGLPLMFSYLAEKTARLPRLKPQAVAGGIGKSTRQAMQLGARWGYRGLVREVFTELMRLPALRKARLIATGGYAAWVVRGMGLPITLAQDLTLEGVGRCFDLTHGREGDKA